MSTPWIAFQGTVKSNSPSAPVERHPAGSSGNLASVGRYVVYADRVKVGGSRAWRNTNPGNMNGSLKDNPTAIGRDSNGFLIFSDEVTGGKAMIALLKIPKFFNLSINDAMKKYAPPHENDTAG